MLVKEKIIGIEEFYFKYGYEINPQHYRNCYFFKIWDKKLSYDSKESLQFLRSQLYESHENPARAIKHLCLMQDSASIDKIYDLGLNGNSFSQYMAVRGMLYFKKTQKAKKIIDKMIHNELNSISTDSIGIHSHFLGYSLIEMLDKYPKYALDNIYIIYKAYRELYPSEVVNEYELYVYSKDQTTKEKLTRDRIRSFQYQDENMKKEVLKRLETFPQWNEILIVRKLKIEFKKEVTVHNK